MSIQQQIKAKVALFSSELKEYGEEHADRPVLEKMFKEISLEAYGLITEVETDESFVKSKIWFNAESLASLCGKDTSRKKKKEIHYCKQCEDVELVNDGERYVCQICGFTKSLFKTKSSQSKTKGNPDRSVIECREWIACLNGEEELPDVVKDKMGLVEDELTKAGYSTKRLPSIGAMRNAFKKASLQTKYKHCVAVRGRIYGKLPDRITDEDSAEIVEMFAIILAGFDELRDQQRVKNIRFIPTIILWIIAKKDWSKKYIDIIQYIPRKSSSTEEKTFALLNEIWGHR